jgi:hypothetical protein
MFFFMFMVSFAEQLVNGHTHPHIELVGKGSALSRIESLQAGSSDAGRAIQPKCCRRAQEFSSYRHRSYAWSVAILPISFWMMAAWRIAAPLLISPQVAINYFSNSYQQMAGGSYYLNRLFVDFIHVLV